MKLEAHVLEARGLLANAGAQHMDERPRLGRAGEKADHEMLTGAHVERKRLKPVQADEDTVVGALEVRGVSMDARRASSPLALEGRREGGTTVPSGVLELRS